MITDYRGRTHTSADMDYSLQENLNTCYARFEASSVSANTGNTAASASTVTAHSQSPNSRKAAGPDGIPGRALKSCAAQVFTSIFNLFLAHFVVPTMMTIMLFHKCCCTCTIIHVTNKSLEFYIQPPIQHLTLCCLLWTLTLD